MARVARPLGISLVTTLACFTPLLCSEVTALRQMALFTMAGLGTVFDYYVLYFVVRDGDEYYTAATFSSSVRGDS